MLRRFLPFLLLALCLPLHAEDWPSWRGPRLDGTSTEKDIPLTWSTTENVLWKTDIPGIGHSSPIISGDRIFVTTCIEGEQKSGQRALLSLDRKTGAILWQKNIVNAKLEQKHGENSFASATPCTDGKNVWVAFLSHPNMVVACYDYDGNKLWEKSPGKLLSVHGFCSSPILHKDLVILNGDQDATAYIVALDKKTGEEKWRIDRPNKTRSYCTPILIQSPTKPEVTQMVLSGSKCVTSYDADTGKLLWIIDGPTEQYVASLVYLDETLFLTTGFPQYHLMGINPDGQGNITRSEFIRWHIGHEINGRKGASYVPSPIAANGHFYVVSDVGYLSCLTSRTGQRVYMEPLGKHHHASPVKIGEHLLFPDDNGITWVVKASDKFEVVAKNELKDPIYASPAVSHGQLFLRTTKTLYCIGKK
jgi:outer membrane protein assembly factor BamB